MFLKHIRSVVQKAKINIYYLEPLLMLLPFFKRRRRSRRRLKKGHSIELFFSQWR
jgi:hypothetical protein